MSKVKPADSVSHQDLTNAKTNIIAQLLDKYQQQYDTNLQKSLELTDITQFIQMLEQIKTSISSSKNIEKTLQANPQWSAISPLFSQIAFFLGKFIDGLRNLININKMAFAGLLREKDKRINNCSRRYTERGQDVSNGFKAIGSQRTINEMGQAYQRMAPVQRLRFHQNYGPSSGGSKQKDTFNKNFKKTFNKNFKKTLMKLDKILENTKICASEKEKKLKLTMNNFKQILDNQLKSFKHILNKSSKKTTKIVKRSINKLKKISKKISKNKAKKISKNKKKIRKKTKN
jgi:vacuolar-type H+-ATPase subunit E/Vma4